MNKELKKTKNIDGIQYFRKPTKSVRNQKRGILFRHIRFSKIWYWFALLILLPLIFFSSKLAANFALDNIEPITLLQNGNLLVLFQNNAEIRSSGGFIGSYALMEIQDFQIKNISFNPNIYALDNQFSKINFVKAPDPISEMTKGQTWALRDANYDASFPEASLDILKFYERETGETVDGIIALNAGVILDLLKLTGPIKLAKYDTEISTDNFYWETQYKVEKEYYQNPENWVVNEPKTFLMDLYPEILKRAFKDKIGLAAIINKNLKDKEIILYFKDPHKQAIAERHNWAGKIANHQELKDLFETNEPVDYLYINSNSYSGNKSSINIEQDVDYNVTNDSKTYNLKAKLKITRIHAGSNLWPDGKNTTWLRIYVPEGADLISIQNNGQNILKDIQIGQEAQKTFFGYKSVIEPGQASVLELSYLLPFNTDDYHLLVQKQPGVAGTDLRISYEGKVLFDGVLDGDKKIAQS